MPTAKAPYLGHRNGLMTAEFSSELKLALRDYFLSRALDASETWDDPADVFVSEVLVEVQWPKAELRWQKSDITIPEIRAEHTDLLRQLMLLCHKLRSLSPDFDQLLGVDADPIGCAEKLQELIPHVEHAGQIIEKLPHRKKLAEKQHSVAVELAIRVLRVLKRNQMSTASTCDADLGHISDAIFILKLIGNDIGLCMADVTWRDIILEAKESASDLK